MKLPENSGFPAFVAQRIEHLTTDQKVGGSSPSKRTFVISRDISPDEPPAGIRRVSSYGLKTAEEVN